MALSTLFVALLGPVLALALAIPGPSSPPPNKGCLDPSPGFLNISAQMASLDGFMAQDVASWNMETIPVYVHVISGTDGRADGSATISDSLVNTQIDVLNKDFESAGFRFELQQVTRLSDDDLSIRSPDEDAIYEVGLRLRKGGWNALNIYVVEDLRPWAGLCSYMPWESYDYMGRYRGDAGSDGCMLMWDAMPPHQPGHIATHEVGHWLGLLHTFQDGCSPSNDYVHDTPAHLQPPESVYYDCNPQRDTCPDLPGLDPVSNFMNYMSEDCQVDGFTWGQANRMHLWWEARKKALPPL